MFLILVLSVFFLLLTYFIINVFSNKGNMCDIEFWFAFAVLGFILGYVCTYNLDTFEYFQYEVSKDYIKTWYPKMKNFLHNHKAWI